MGDNDCRRTEIKVGLFTIIGVALIFAIAVFVGKLDIGGSKGYKLNVYFKVANGLAVGNQVRYAGVKAGRVEEIELLPTGINVTLRMDPGVKVPVDSNFSLGVEGLMGSRFVGIQPPENPGTLFLKHGASVLGTVPPSVDDMIASLTSLVAEVELVVKNVNDTVGSPEGKASLKMAMINVGLISENIRMASESLNRISAGSEADIQAIVSNMRAASGDMKLMIDKISDNGKGGEDIRQMLKDMKTILGRIDRITASVEGLATDPQTINDVKATLHNASEASSKINRILGKGGSSSGSGNSVNANTSQNSVNINTSNGSGGISTEGDTLTIKKPTSSRKFFQGGVDFSYSPDEREWRGDANVTLGGDRFVRIGAQDIGEENNLELQAGMWRGPVAFRAGVFESKLGAGIDWQVADNWKLSFDGYDPNDFKYRLRSELGFGKKSNTALIAQLYGRNRSTSTYLGIRQNF